MGVTAGRDYMVAGYAAFFAGDARRV